MPQPASLESLLERLVVAGVAITTRALADASDDWELTFPQWRALLIVGEADDGATVSAVAARVGVTVPATSRLLQRLARRGLLNATSDEQDRRATRARLTARGIAVRERIIGRRRALIAERARTLRLSDSTLHELEQVGAAFDGVS
ncbi:MAG TPA: MarR family transcriptional regulator [Candidatus Limnocylindrales bacterium]|nr:MarR family transcriptional regulator [Candidatus Limnocylindrales bacterium]